MIQLKKSTTTNTLAFYPDRTITDTLVQLKIDYTQDLDNATGSFTADVTGQKNWIVASVPGAEIQTPSGQFTLDIKPLTEGAALVWGEAAVKFQDAATRWDAATGTNIGQTISVERAYIEGVNEVSYTTYNSPNENGSYTTYNS